MTISDRTTDKQRQNKIKRDKDRKTEKSQNERKRGKQTHTQNRL